MGSVVKGIRCEGCGDTFSRSLSEYNRNKREKKKLFCTQSCATRFYNRVTPRGSAEHLNPGNKRDELTPFRWFMNRVTARQGETDLTIEYLKELWGQQGGLCPVTGWKLTLPTSTRGWPESLPENASLDQIVPSKGYSQGNIRFVALMANYAKHTWTDLHVLDFCRAVLRQ